MTEKKLLKEIETRKKRLLELEKERAILRPEILELEILIESLEIVIGALYSDGSNENQ